MPELARRKWTLARPARGLLIAALLCVAPAAAQQTPGDFLTDAPPPDDEVVRQLQDDQVVRMSFKQVDVDAIGGPENLDGARALLLDLFDDVQLVAVRDRIERRGLEAYTWFGSVNGNPETQVLLVVRGGRLTGAIHMLGETYDIVSLDGDPRHAVREIDQSLYIHEEPEQDREIPDVPVSTITDDPDPLAASFATGLFARRSIFSDAQPPAETLSMHCGNDDWIDVMVVYTADADAAPGDMLGEIQAAIDDSNQSYMNSGIAQRLRLVHAAEVEYAESGDAPTDRNRLKDPGDGFMDGVHALRDSHGADIVSLWTRTSNYCGYAYIMGTVDVAFEDRAFNVVTLGCAVDNHSFAHELGHNMSARHDRYVDGTDGSPHAYNHGFVNLTDSWRTIMSYNDECEDAGGSCTRLPYWSNPDVSYGGDAMGIADGDPEAADNARTLDATRATVQDFRDAHAPVAEAGPDEVGECGIPTTLDGSGSCDPDGDPLTYAWTGGFAEGGGTTTGAMPQVTYGKGVHTVTLVVSDGSTDSVPDTVEVDTTTDATDPDVTCPADLVVSCTDPTDPGATGTGSATDLCDASPDVGFADAEVPGDCPQERTIERSWTATDDDGNAASCLQTIQVDDSSAPQVSCGVAIERIWPPNHKFHDVGFSFSSSDDCDEQPGFEIAVTSDEHPALSTGSGGAHHCPDAMIDPESGAVLLRAERSGAGDGRVYVITVTATDACGNASTCSAEVRVPKSQAHGGSATDSGQAYDASACDGGAMPLRNAARSTASAEKGAGAAPGEGQSRRRRR